MKRGLGYEKTFQYKGQMINYFNKVKANPNVDFVMCGHSSEKGYYCFYTYKKSEKN